ncbi:hypothetical protein DH96_00370 [Candidatus Phytoplasma oryzae]|nr:hypothetical protein [Candidatus Phytoplasma oryzae]RAM58000.1 hypothetical protein DH96_00370 [Candidatus Phytoplasma oryzae]
MRIIPYELYKYTPNLSLCALRKEFGMYDYCLNNRINNRAMQPFLNLGRNYFNLSFIKWVEEMKKRNHYINNFHLFYSANNTYNEINTDFFLILECCIQWEIKCFVPYKSSFSWYKIAKENLISSHFSFLINNFNLKIYKILLIWYKSEFMKINKNGFFKPKKLNMLQVIEYFDKSLR